MKLRIENTTPGLLRDDIFAFAHRESDGAVHVVELTQKAQNELVLQLMSAHLSRPSVNLFPTVVKAAPLDNGMVGVLLGVSESHGFSFGVTQDIAARLIDHLQSALESSRSEVPQVQPESACA